MGIITFFEFFTAPALTNRFETNTLTLTWCRFPQPMLLQWSLTPFGEWTNYPSQIGGNAAYREANISASLLQSGRFFRLYWDTPQPLPHEIDPSLISEPLFQLDPTVPSHVSD